MKKPLVAIVGRPNVGKSTFFNKICGRRISIVEDMPGVTRDRIYADAVWQNNVFTLVDTGGIDVKSKDEISCNILAQAQIAIDLADLILFMVDGKQGLTTSDFECCNLLRKSKKEIILVVNKLDNFEIENTYEFYNLGIGEPIPISCAQGKGLGDLLELIVSKLSHTITEEENNESIKIALVGKPNVGKSSITNKILGEDRVVVSNQAGTTRDAIDTPFRYHNQDFTIIDTAGMRKKKNIDDESIERYSVIRSLEAVKRADIVLIVIDGSEPISEQDIKVAGYVHEENKPSIVIVNKWDKVEKDERTYNKYLKDIKEKFSFMNYVKPLFISAVTGQRFNQIMPTVLEILENNSRRIPTSTLNDLLQEAINITEPPIKNGKRLKIMYMTQSDIKPPTFVFFCNDASLMHFSYLRYLENRIREAINFEGTPIKLICKNRNEKEE